MDPCDTVQLGVIAEAELGSLFRAFFFFEAPQGGPPPTYVYICVDMSLYVYVYVCVFMCVYVYVYMCVYVDLCKKNQNSSNLKRESNNYEENLITHEKNLQL